MSHYDYKLLFVVYECVTVNQSINLFE